MRKVYTSYLTRDLIVQSIYSPKLGQWFLGYSSPDVAMSVYTLAVEDKNAAFDVRAKHLPQLPLEIPSDMGLGDGSKEENGDF